MANERPAPTGAGTDGAPTPGRETEASRSKPQTQFKVADVRETDATLELEDGRVFVARLADNVDKEELRRGRLVTITSDGMDKSDAPKDAVITRILPKE